MYTHMYTHMYLYYIYIYVLVHIRVFIHMYTSVCMHTSMILTLPKPIMFLKSTCLGCLIPITPPWAHGGLVGAGARLRHRGALGIVGLCVALGPSSALPCGTVGLCVAPGPSLCPGVASGPSSALPSGTLTALCGLLAQLSLAQRHSGRALSCGLRAQPCPAAFW